MCCGNLPNKMTRPPDRRLLSYLASYDPHVADLTLALREVVLEEAPDAIESIVKGYAVAIGFSFTGKPLKNGFCHSWFQSRRFAAGSEPRPGGQGQDDSSYHDPRSRNWSVNLCVDTYRRRSNRSGGRSWQRAKKQHPKNNAREKIRPALGALKVTRAGETPLETASQDESETHNEHRVPDNQVAMNPRV
jgi:hypothetical protein